MRFCTILALALAPMLSACGAQPARPTSAGAGIAIVATSIDRLEARYRSVRAVAMVMVPLLAPSQADRILAVDARIVRAFAAARAATDTAAQIAAITAASGALDDLIGLAGI